MVETPNTQAAPADADRVAVETLLAPLPTWEQAALRVAGNWPLGQLITREQFEQVREKTMKAVIR